MCPEQVKDDEEHVGIVNELESSVHYMLILFSLVLGFSLTILVDLIIVQNPGIAIFIIFSVASVINLIGLSYGIRFVTFSNRVSVLKKFNPQRYEWIGKNFIEGYPEKKGDYTQEDYALGMSKYFDKVKYIFFISLVILLIAIIIVIVEYVIVVA